MLKHDGSVRVIDNTSTVALSTPELEAQLPEHEFRLWPRTKTADEEAHANWEKQFRGGVGLKGLHRFHRPKKTSESDPDQHVMLDHLDIYGGSVSRDEKHGKFRYLNQFGQWEVKHSDVAVYLSPTNYRPKRLVVQATRDVLRNHAPGDWRRRRMNGDVPKILKFSEWALKPFKKKGFWHKVDGSLRMLMISVPLQIMLACPGTASWDNDDVDDTYKDHPAYHWQWPKHAINRLDQKPDTRHVGSEQKGLEKQTPSSRQRKSRPRKLYVKQDDGAFAVVDDPPRGLQYIFVSYARISFSINGEREDAKIRAMAERATLEAGYTACWIDTDCMDEKDGAQKNADIYAMCDVIRGSQRVVVILPDNRLETRRAWGGRMWTLPEALLARDAKLYFLAQVDENLYETKSLGLIDLTSEIWDDRESSEDAGGSTRLLAEHYSGELTLSRIELFVTAVDAFFWRSNKDPRTFFTDGDVTMAVMSLVHNRLEFRDGDDDTSFQLLAQLSLGNDTDRIVERMVSLYPRPRDPSDLQAHTAHSLSNPFYTLTNADQYGTYLWDIQPLCYAVGVAHEDNTVILDSCRVMSIRWKGFPQISVVRDAGLGRLLATFFVTAGTWWFVQGIYVTINYAPLLHFTTLGDNNSLSDLQYALVFVIAAFLFTAIFLSIFGPLSVRRLYGGDVLQSSSNLVGFEGIMPIKDIECLMFGNFNNRLSYEPGSSPICADNRDPILRQCIEPDWVQNGNPQYYPELPKGHRYFTLVDTGTLTVTIFSAERPPTVALLSGREGGMLRAVLCSWRFENDCLYKEAVVRMTSDTWEEANLKAWLKVCLLPMSQQEWVERENVKLRQDRRDRKARDAAERRSS
ncbi:hypothetical protein F5Y16DRAFT_413696 [Xylariaceae sp. FL0255]|nr:hypothetical protein F5Y16DRAFT_413696 [Xylariaceae sp. FL0255]